MRRSARLAGATALIAAMVLQVVPGDAARAAPRVYPVRAVIATPSAFDAVLSVDVDGRYAVANNGSSDALLDLATGAAVDQGPNARDRIQGRWSIDILTGNRFSRTDILTGAAQTYTVPFTAAFRLGGVSGYSEDGRVVGVAGLLPNDLARWFLFDTTTGQLLIPEPGVAAPETYSFLLDVARDGSAIVTADLCCIGGWFTSIRRVDVRTGSTTVVPKPPEHDAIGVGWFTSKDLEWVWFRTTSAVVPGVSAGTSRWYRRHVPTGITSALPVDATLIRDLVPDDDGRLVFTMTPTGNDAALQAYFWKGGGFEPEMITVAADGTPADLPVRAGFLWWSEDADRVTLQSFASNLVPSLPPAPAGRLYQITLPDDVPANPTTIVQPSSTMCVPARGADPGDVVAVNITPLAATSAGFGTMHPGGTSPGSTSNVNYGPGSVDPNVALVDVGANGTVCFSASVHGPVHVIIDELIVGDGAAFVQPTALGAVRIADTRIGQGGTRLAPAEQRCLDAPISARPGDTLVVNALGVGASGPGFGTFHSSDRPAGLTSNINYFVGSFDPNLAFVIVGPDGRICFTNGPSAAVDLVADALVVGDASAFRAPTPEGATRLIDTRIGLGGDLIAASERRCVAATGAVAGEYVVLNATPVGATTPGFGTLHSSDDPAGATSNVNFGPGSTDPNVALTRVGVDGRVCFTNSVHGPVHLVLDEMVIGNASVFSQPSAAGSTRLADTRIGR